MLDCALRKIQPNIKGGGAKFQRTVRYISADIIYTARQLMARFCQLLIYVPIYSSFLNEQGHFRLQKQIIYSQSQKKIPYPYGIQTKSVNPDSLCAQITQLKMQSAYFYGIHLRVKQFVLS